MSSSFNPYLYNLKEKCLIDKLNNLFLLLLEVKESRLVLMFTLKKSCVTCKNVYEFQFRKCLVKFRVVLQMFVFKITN